MKKVKKFLFYVIAAYAVFGFLVLPFIVKAQLPKLIEQNTYTKASVASIYINPFLFKTKISGLKISDLQEKPLLSIDTLFLDFDIYSLLYSTINIAKLEISEPHIYVVNNQDKTLNLLNILKTSSKSEPTAETNSTMPRIKLGRIKVDDAQIDYTDLTRSTPFHFTFDQLDFELKDVDTNDFNSSNGVIAFYSNLGDGAFLQIKTEIDGFKPFALHGHIDFKASQLYTEWSYIKDMVNFEVADGRASFNADYSLNLDKLDETKIDNLNFAVNKLRIKPKDKSQDIILLENFHVNNVDVLPMKQKLHIGDIGLNTLHINLNRLKNGEIDIPKYFIPQSSEEEQEQNQTVSESQSWNIAIDDVALEKISTTFTDYTLEKPVISKISDLRLGAKNIVVNSEKPFSYQLSTLINDTASCKIGGRIVQKPLELSSRVICKDFDVTHYNPYIDQAAKSSLKRYNVSLDSLLTGVDLNFRAEENNNTVNIFLDDSQLSLNNFQLSKRSAKEKLLNFDSFIFDGINFDLNKEELGVKQISLNGFKSYLQRYNNGKLNIENLVVPKKSAKQTSKKEKEGSFHLNVEEFDLNNAQVNFSDSALEQKAKQTLSNINVQILNIDSNKNTWLTYKTSMRVNKKGQVYTNGKLRHTPLKQSGRFNLKNISLEDINPYLNEAAYVKIEDGKLALKGTTSYAKSTKRPDLIVNGKLILNSLFINNSQDNELLFSLDKLDVKKFTYELSPDRLFVDEVDIDAFYVDAFVDENKTLNFAKLSKKADTNTSELKKEKGEPFDAKIVKVNVTNGSAKFADFSIPIKFQTHIHDLNGVIYVLSSKPGETSYVNILGEVDKYGSTTLVGSIDASSPKLYTDLDFNFKNLELSAMSGYSATFAGYKIDSGKLYLDLGYDIMNSQMQGSNNVIINKIKLGDEIEDENVTHLPLGFVIGLLEDNEGIIDLDLPVEGNVDAPDFKYGTVVWKVFSNLVTKAVTAPFALLGSMMGIDGEELSYIEFEDGKAVITPSQREKLDNIVKMMMKRPKINLGISATYDKKADLFALKREKLIAIVVEKSGVKNINERENALTIDLLEDIYEDLRDDDKLDQLQEKLEKEYKDEDFQRVYQKELLALDIEIQQVSQQELDALAKKRQTIIENYFIEEKLMSPNRLEIMPVEGIDESSESIVKNRLEVKVNN
ncbi:DUF748 domain-containing protein [Sulfurimonas sp. C5]|uniref:DUF748 domain-containing protein n=1 Tax=Sulfurimonas sp. C5 TaxID=3036947 RepID=UPI002454722E|nr:DUF748 domain-containing protein [Sulfurimonas sp. C5]MDH4945432.1 DUF748 domain-containing protein [Sulfurimonas sp. C5]